METIRIENWVFFAPNASPYTAPECLKMSLNGEVFRHPKHKDGETLTTSTVRGLGDIPNSVRTNSGTVYILGEPRCDYEAQFPGAKERLLKSLS